MADVQNTDVSKIIKRLEMIKSLISLEEEDEIGTHISKLEQLPSTAELIDILVCLKEKMYSKAVTAIEIFISKHQSLTVYIDPKIDALKLEIKALEAAINILSNEKADIEKLIHEFGIRHNKELGELIIKIFCAFVGLPLLIMKKLSFPGRPLLCLLTNSRSQAFERW